MPSSARRSNNALVMLLAGGEGERLYPLTKNRAKPAVTFGGLYRIIDFTLSSCLNSGLRRIYVLTQHKSLSLDRHIRNAWSILHPEMDEFIQTVPPQLRLVSRWYAGTADAVFQNMHLLEAERPDHVVILSGDHVYRLDYGLMLRFHLDCGADLTIACTEIPREEASRMGVLEIDDRSAVLGFAEKPADPKAVPHDPTRALVNMGVYIFRTESLVRAVIDDAKREDSQHDFGRNVIPAMVQSARVFAYDVVRRAPSLFHYWQDIGTLDSYYAAHMELLEPKPAFDIFSHDWPLRTYQGQHPPALIRNEAGMEARAVNSIVSPGCVISGGTVMRSILSPDVYVAPGAVVEESILMPGVRIGERAHLRRTMVDEGVSLPRCLQVGINPEEDRRMFQVTESGLVVVPEGVVLE